MNRNCARPEWVALCCSLLLQPLWSYAQERNAPDVCLHVAELANTQQLATTVEQQATDANDIPVPKALETRPLALKIHIDINNDGKKEYVYVLDATDATGNLFAAYSERLEPIAIIKDPHNDWNSETLSWPDKIDVIRYRNKPYLIAYTGVSLRYVASISSKNIETAICQFAQGARPDNPSGEPVNADGSPKNFVLSELDVLLAQADGRTPWEYALSLPDMSAAEILLRNGFSVNDKIAETPLLSWAVWQEKTEAVDWLIKHGSEVNPVIDSSSLFSSPLWEAVRADNPDIALRLLKAGANPQHLLQYQADFNSDPNKWRAVTLEVQKKTDRIPYSLVLSAIEHDAAGEKPSLLDDLIDSGLPPDNIGKEWFNGALATVPYGIRALDLSINNGEISNKINRLYKRGVVYSENSATYVYGSVTNGFIVLRYKGSNVSDEELAMTSTSICLAFMKKNCGPDELIRKAEAWNSQLPYSCPVAVQSSLGTNGCKVAMHFVKLNLVGIFLIEPGSIAAGGYKGLEHFNDLKKFGP